MNELLATLTFDAQGLIPAVIQDDGSGDVLMVAYMNREALEKTDYTGLVGNIKFNEKHQAYGQTVYMAQIRNKVPVVVKTAKIARP